jgi:hypothetical protein
LIGAANDEVVLKASVAAQRQKTHRQSQAWRNCEIIVPPIGLFFKCLNRKGEFHMPVSVDIAAERGQAVAGTRARTSASQTDFKTRKITDSPNFMAGSRGRYVNRHRLKLVKGDERAFAEREQKKIADTDRPCGDVRLSEIVH